PLARSQQRRMLSKYKKRHTHQQKNRELKQHNEAARQQRAPAVLLISPCQKPLHDRLVRSVARHGQERATIIPDQNVYFVAKFQEKSNTCSLFPLTAAT